MITSFNKSFIITITAILISSLGYGQKVRIAQLDEGGEIYTYQIESEKINYSQSREAYQQIQNFPFASLAHPNFKNFRNVTISDIDQNGSPEILVCMNETLFVLNGDASIKWEYRLNGTSNVPPAVADIDKDGDLEIALQTYGVPSVGNVYLFDHEGNLEEGWPLNISNNLFLNGVTLADMNNDGSLEIVASQRISTTSGVLHALKPDATNIEDWPVSIPGTPAFTPSVGDIDNDGNPELITSTTSALYVIKSNGEIFPGFPQAELGSKFSYQSPLLADLDNNESLEIIGSRHGDLPGTYVFNKDAQYHAQWPQFDFIWTYAPPTVVDIDQDGDLEIFFSRPYVSANERGAVVLAYDHLGNPLDGFPIQDYSGSEGIVAIADIDNDGDFEIITASKAAVEGRGAIHAYHFESGEEAENFPITVKGFTFLNGANLSDVDNDGLLDLTALSYQLNFQQSPDTAFINVFNLDVPYDESSILFNGYKGSNTHSGLLTSLTTKTDDILEQNSFEISPNPVRDKIRIDTDLLQAYDTYMIFNLSGQMLSRGKLGTSPINVEHLLPGKYTFLLSSEKESTSSRFVKI